MVPVRNIFGLSLRDLTDGPLLAALIAWNRLPLRESQRLAHRDSSCFIDHSPLHEEDEVLHGLHEAFHLSGELPGEGSFNLDTEGGKHRGQ